MSQSHTIARTILEIHIGRLGDVWSLQEEVSRLLRQQALPKMEALFDRLVSPEDVIRLDQVAIELPPLDEQGLATDFVPALLAALEQSLSDHLAGYHPVQTQTVQERRDRPSADWEIFLYFLRYGRLPWWGQSDVWEGWLTRWQTALQSNTHWDTPFRALIASSPTACHRLVVQFSEAFQHQLVLSLQPTWVGWRSLLSQADQLLQGLHLNRNTMQTLHHSAWALLFAHLSHSDQTRPLPSASWTQQWFRQLIQHELRQENTVLNAIGDRFTLLQQQTDALTEEGDRLSLNSIEFSNSTALLSEAIEAHWQALIQLWITTDQPLWFSALHQSVDLLVAQLIASSSSISPASEAFPLADPPALEGGSNSTPISDRPSLLAAFRRQTMGDRASTPSEPDLALEEQSTGIYLNQAGLVLLYPFLRSYFNDAGLLAGNQFQNAASQQMAIYLLHYLATRQIDPPEYELVLPKLLCGWSLDETTICPELPEAMLIQAEQLLQAVIEHWNALKSTSPDGLREGFLQREGKLTRTGDTTWKLKVEQQAIDILLSRLPWGISAIKLPWMHRLLLVEWT